MKKMGKVIVLLLVIAFIGAGFAFAGGKQEESKEESKSTEKAAPKQEEPKEEPILIAMATDVGGLGDKSFNDGSWEGLKKAEREFENVEARVVESKQMTDYVPNLSGLAEDGAKVVFAVGFLMEEAMIESAQMNPDAYFAGIDIFVDPSTAPPNARGILFKEQEAGYLAGVLAGLMTKEYADATDKLNDDNVVGMVLGMDIPPVERYQAGFYAGVQSVNPECKVLSVVTGSFTDQAKGKESAMAMIEQGADIIFQVAGLTGVGAINAAKEAGILAIGVDVDQNAVAPNTVLTSAEKKLTNAAFLTVKDVLEGTFEGGTVTLGINEGATGISPFHSFDSVVPQAVKDAINKTIADMKAGKIDIPATRAEAGYEG
jgi:basic membrane protein A and related proteins